MQKISGVQAVMCPFFQQGALALDLVVGLVGLVGPTQVRYTFLHSRSPSDTQRALFWDEGRY